MKTKNKNSNMECEENSKTIIYEKKKKETNEENCQINYI